jgi:hypothetical protein
VVAEFFVWLTSPCSLVIGDEIDADLAAGVTNGGGVHTNQPGGSGAVIVNLQREIQDLRDWLVSTCVTMGNLVFPTLEYTTKLTTLELQ